VVQIETLAVALCHRLRHQYPTLLATRYKLDPATLSCESISDYDLFLAIGKKRGFLVSGGEVNEERTANTLLDEFRAAKIGKITLDNLEEETT
jgi:ribosome biogenesis GTPase A